MQSLRNCAYIFRFGNLLTASPMNLAPRYFSIFSQGVPVSSAAPKALLEPTSPLTETVRTKARNYWPKPKETKRIRVSGLKKRLLTPTGRKIIFNKLLKGKHVLGHWF